MRKGIVLVMLASMLGGATGVVYAEPPDTPKTEIEKFTSQHGIILIQGFTTQGVVSGSYSTTVEVTLTEVRQASSVKRLFGVIVKVTEAGRIKRDNSAFVDESELESLIDGISYLQKVEPAATSLKSFQAQYLTVGGLVISIFSSDSGLTSVVKIERLPHVSAWLGLSELAEFRALLEASRTSIRQMRETPPEETPVGSLPLPKE